MKILQSLIWIVVSFGISAMLMSMFYVILLKILVFLKVFTYKKRPLRGKDGTIILVLSIFFFLFLIIKNKHEIFPYLY